MEGHRRIATGEVGFRFAEPTSQVQGSDGHGFRRGCPGLPFF